MCMGAGGGRGGAINGNKCRKEVCNSIFLPFTVWLSYRMLAMLLHFGNLPLILSRIE